jgi:hypothetical protein
MSQGSRSGDSGGTPKQQAEMDAFLRESMRYGAADGHSAGKTTGRPLHLTSTPFIQSRESIVTGLIGPPPWAVRLRRIEDGRERLQATVEAAWAEYARRWRGRPEEFAQHWRAYLALVDLSPLNALIQKHNDWYPVEARLPIVYPTGEYAIPFGVKYPQKLVEIEEILEQFPADLDMALYFTRQE